MLTLTTHKFLFFRKQETWFYDNESVNEGTYTVYCYCRCKLNPPYDHYLPEQSAYIDLGVDKTRLFNGMTRTYRYQVRKAQKLPIHVSVNEKPSVTDCNEFLRDFNGFASTKQIPDANSKRIHALQRSGNVVFTHIKRNNEPLVTHAYIHDSKTVLLLHTFHHNRQLLDQERGLFNKFLHWQDILYFHQKGFKWYDLGGINFETVPGISRFKLDFGAQVYDVRNYVRIKGWIAPIVHLIKKLRP